MTQQTENQTNTKSRFKQTLNTTWDRSLAGKLLVIILASLGVTLAAFVLYFASKLWLFLLILIVPLLMILVFLPPFRRFLYHRIGRLNQEFGFRSGKPLKMTAAILAYSLLSAEPAVLIVGVGNSVRLSGANTAIQSMTATLEGVAQVTKSPFSTPELPKLTHTAAPSATSIPPSATPMPTNTSRPEATSTVQPTDVPTQVPSDTPQPTDIPAEVQHESSQPTDAPTATEVATNTPSPTKVPARPTATEVTPTDEMIMDVPGILGKTAAVIEKSLGKSAEILPMRVGDAAELPDGGESRTYSRGQYTFYLFFDRNGTAKGFLLTEGLGESYGLNRAGDLLTRFGFSTFKLPDMEAPAAKRWNNFSGYKIEVVASRINGPVWSVQIWRLQ